VALLLSCQSIGKSFGAKPLFENISFGISEGDSVGLVGPNGAGKSTLLRILAGLTDADDGVISARKLLRLGYVAQLWEGPGDATIQQAIDSAPAAAHLDAPERIARTHEILGRAGFADRSVRVASLSGGWRKRLAIALELLKDPELLILDEPTNHLDLEGILWLEKLLMAAPFASLIVSHDRYFLENVATRMMEINRAYPDGLLAVNGNYSEFLVKKDEFLHAQAKHQESLENQVKREIEWLRRGPKARTTKSKARIDSAGRLIEELSDVSARSVKRSAQIDFSATDRRTKRLIEGERIGKSLGGRELFRDLSFVLAPGTRMGLLGPNGSGKSTLLRIITAEMQPDAGELKRADRVQIVYFDQNRELLNPAVPLRKALAPDGDSVIYRDRPIHVAAWASRFLFRSEQLDVAVGRLSGGEQARVAIARLMLQSADVLLLDEPTNDLDIPTLEVLEDSLLEFPGALVLVSHDRYLLDRVSTQILGLDGGGGSALYADCEQWERELSSQKKSVSRASRAEEAVRSTAQPRKLSYLENREWEGMEELIQQAEDRLRAAQEELQNPHGAAERATMENRYQAVLSAQADVDRLYARWAELEAKLAG
jgi:ATP-binding cassette subfamily F protein uup